MAKNVYRVTPRSSEVIRAIEVYLQERCDRLFGSHGREFEDGKIILNAGDFEFEDVGEGQTRVVVSGLEVVYLLPNLAPARYELMFEGELLLTKRTLSMAIRGQKKRNFVYYTTDSIQLDQTFGEDD